MSELLRLLRYVRPYWLLLLASVVLMAFAGASQGLIALLIEPIFDRALNPAAPAKAIKLFDIPLLERTVYLSDLLPGNFQDVWVMTATAILLAFFVRGLADYFGNLFINRVGTWYACFRTLK